MRRWGIVIFAVLALVAGSGLAWAYMQFRGIERADVELAKAEKQDPLNFLLVGSDTRELEKVVDGGKHPDAPGGQRADTIMVARIDPEMQQIEMLTIPRDLWIEKADGNPGRINAAYGEGPQGLVDAIDRELGIPIHHYIEVNFDGFRGIVDAMGGIGLYFDRPVYDKNSGLNIRKKGCYQLDGHQALAFARSRELHYSNGVKWIADPTGDLGRSTRQQIFMRRALSKMSTLGIDDVGTLTSLIGVAKQHLVIDERLGVNDIRKLAGQFSSFDSAGMAVHRLATESKRTSGGALVEVLIQGASQPVIDIFTGKAPMQTPDEVRWAAIKPENVTVDVLNGTDISGIARTGAANLEELDFVIGEIADGPNVAVTTIRYSEAFAREAMVVASKLGEKPEMVIDPSLTNGRIVVVLGSELMVRGVNAPDEDPVDTTTTTLGSGSSDGDSSDGEQTSTTIEMPTTTVKVDTPIGIELGLPPAGIDCPA